MKQQKLVIVALATLCNALAALDAHASCGAAFCAINTNWDAHGAWSEPGLRLDLRYESIRQTQLQEGRRKVAVGEVPRDHDEVETKNQNWVAGLDYTVDADWGINVALPVVKRHHLHLANDPVTGEQTPETWDFAELGDARVLARRRLKTFESADHSLGVAGMDFGLKLPTGRYDMRNAAGERAERTLQPGTGTTDALLGAYFSRLLPMKDLSWFAQGLLQQALNSRESYRPGRRVSLDAGLRYDASERVGLLLQVNALYRGRDSGANAEPEDSGGKSLFLSPGVSVGLTKDTRAYGFLQLPLYQYVNGVQLVASRALIIGLSSRF
jgi:hypothetical protein